MWVTSRRREKKERTPVISILHFLVVLLVGRSSAEFPELVRRMAAQGHTVAQQHVSLSPRTQQTQSGSGDLVRPPLLGIPVRHAHFELYPELPSLSLSHAYVMFITI